MKTQEELDKDIASISTNDGYAQAIAGLKEALAQLNMRVPDTTQHLIQRYSAELARSGSSDVRRLESALK